MTVNGADVTDVAVVLSPGATIAGTVTFPSAATAAPDVTQFRIIAPAADPGDSIGPQANARLDKDGRFTLTGLPAGLHFLRAGGNARGWTLKSVTVGGRDVTDTPIELRSGETVGNVTIVFTDKVNEINGQVMGGQGTPAAEYTVLAFSTEASYWRPQSRQIATTRPDQTGQVPNPHAAAGRILRGGGRPRRAGRVVRTVIPGQPSGGRGACHAVGGRRQDAGPSRPAVTATGSGFRVQGAGFVPSAGCRVQGAGFSVPGFQRAGVPGAGC